MLTGIGDVLGTMGRHVDATNTDSRDMGHQQELLQKFANDVEKQLTIPNLQCHRGVTESNTLIAKQILACPTEEDVITMETQTLLVQAVERVDYAQGYYDKAQDQLQETLVMWFGHITAKGIDLGQEKEDICFASTMVMAVGTQLAMIDEEAKLQESKVPAKKKRKDDEFP